MVELLEYLWDLIGVGTFLIVFAAIPILWRAPYEDD